VLLFRQVEIIAVLSMTSLPRASTEDSRAGARHRADRESKRGPRGRAKRIALTYVDLGAFLLTWDARRRRVFIEGLSWSGIVEVHTIHLA
jgi:hypothetical protein